MSKKEIFILLFTLGVAGFLFSGYLSGVKFFSSDCAFNESCPYFWGYPACYYGFFLFAILVTFGALLLFSRISERKGLEGLSFVSLLGILFSGYFTIQELPLLLQNGFGAYSLGLPTCAWGFVFYLLIFSISFTTLRRRVF